MEEIFFLVKSYLRRGNKDTNKFFTHNLSRNFNSNVTKMYEVLLSTQALYFLLSDNGE